MRSGSLVAYDPKGRRVNECLMPLGDLSSRTRFSREKKDMVVAAFMFKTRRVSSSVTYHARVNVRETESLRNGRSHLTGMGFSRPRDRKVVRSGCKKGDFAS